MTNKEQIIRNIGLSFDFLKVIAKSPSMLETLNENSSIEFVEKDFKSVKRPVKDNRRNFIKVKSSFETVK